MNETLFGRISHALEERGRRIALVAEEVKVSGKELLERALDLAAALHARGVKTGDTVGLLVDRSVDTVVSLLAALSLECPYLPLDLAAPQKWHNHLLTIARAGLLVFPDGSDQDRAVARDLAPLLPLGSMSAHTLTAGAGCLPKVSASRQRHRDCLAYIIGTSGTSGTPKAVPIRASSLLHYCDAFAAFVGGAEVLAGMRMASATTLAADLGNTMVFPSLLFGGELHLMPLAVARDPQRFADYIQEHDIDALKVVPTHLRVLLEQGTRALPHRLLVVGGESFGLDLLAALEVCIPPTCAVFNHYGPTEATVGVTMYPVNTKGGKAENLKARGYRTVPIGTVLGDNELRVVDEQLKPCVEGHIGELVVSGPSLSEGYLGSTDQSSLRFVEANWSSYGVAYRTGDLARVCPTGEIELFGRRDRQYKIRGYRVEAAGVEEELRAHPGVFDAFVDYRDQGEFGMALMAWVHADDGVDDATLRGFLGEKLPDPMVPSRIIVMKALPRTPNGKIDSTALPDLQTILPTAGPCSIEDAVVRVFARIFTLPLAAAHGNFFRLGGHSLAALQAIALLRKDYGLEVRIDDFYKDASPVGIARVARPGTRLKPAEPGVPQGPQVSPQAHALWTHLRMNPVETAYEIPVRLRVIGPVTPERIHSALTNFVVRHEALRTRFKSHDGKPAPVVDHDHRFTLKLADGQGHGNVPAGHLDIENGPLVRGTVTVVGSNEVLIDLLVHHIAYDGISGAVLVRELAAMLAGEPLPPVQQVHAEAQVFRASEDIPLGDGSRAHFGLPPAQLFPDGPSRCHEIWLPGTLWTQVETCATGLNTTPFVIAAAAWALVLSRQDSEPAITIGTPADLRHPMLEDRLVGYHTNIVVIEMKLSPNDTVLELIKRTHNAVGRALEDRHRPYATLVAQQRALTGTPPTRTLLTIERLERIKYGDIQIHQESIVQARPVFDLDVCLIVAGQIAALQIQHRVSVCPENRTRHLVDQLLHVLTQFVARPTVNCSNVGIVSVPWAERIMGWSHGDTTFLLEERGPRSLRNHLVANSDAIALIWPGGQWSCSQFAKAVVRTMRLLRDCGLGPGHVVAIELPPSPALAVAWHAAQEVGATVLALDPAWPRQRLDAAASQARAQVRINSPDGVNVNVVGSVGTTVPYDCDLAYLILTSGSTGVPKLVGIQHSALLNELSWSASTFQIGNSDRVLAHSSPAFDVTVWDMLGPLSWGACLVFPAMGRRNDIPHLAELIQDQRVTVIQAVPSLLEALLCEFAPGRLPLRLLLSGGEEMPQSLPLAVAERLPEATLVNTYGPSETAIDVTSYHIQADTTATGRVPLGKPIAGTSAYVIDTDFHLLPPGAWGQLAIAGNSVGWGYLGDPGATGGQFVPDPFSAHAGARMYLTGDRARWNDDGLLEFGGRYDHQVKVRGNRVELEDVEAALRKMPMVRDAVVYLEHGGTMRARLVALVVPRERGALTVRDLHKHSAQLLPSYMMPSVFGLIESVPRLSNGKVARHALPRNTLEATAPADQLQTQMEIQVGRVWMEVLGHKALEPDLPFFASGGTSLLIPVLQVRLREAVGVALSVPELFEHTTISAQATAIEQRRAGLSLRRPVVAGRGKLRRQAYTERTKPPIV